MTSVSGWLSRLRHVIGAFALAACGGASSGPSAGGESHFLKDCADDCGPNLECVADVCTRACVVGKDSCADLLAAATCTNASIEPGSVAICDVGCEVDANCAALGAGFTCQAGFCRTTSTPAQPDPTPTSGGAAGAPSGGAPSGGAAGAAPNDPGACDVATGTPCNANEVCMPDATPRCDLAAPNSCKGHCVRAYEAPTCAGLGSLGISCPTDMSCVPSLNDALDIQVCVSSDATCDPPTPSSCPSGFECVTTDAALGHCSPGLVDCSPPLDCNEGMAPPECPFTYARAVDQNATDGSCYGPCVPVQNCVCGGPDDCPDGSACDLGRGHCVAVKWKEPELCSRPFPTEVCDAIFFGYALLDGQCQPASHGGCGRPPNLFGTLEECMSTCEGRPVVSACPVERIPSPACVACGGGGGCSRYLEICALPCTGPDDCDGLNCIDGTCQRGECL